MGPETQRWQGDVYKTTYMKNKHGEDAVWVFLLLLPFHMEKCKSVSSKKSAKVQRLEMMVRCSKSCIMLVYFFGKWNHLTYILIVPRTIPFVMISHRMHG